MQVLKQFSIPIRGLEMGHHDYAFKIDKSFFAEFELSPIQESSLNVTVRLEKMSDQLSLLLDINGTIHIECDRCCDLIDYPIENSDFPMVVKYDADEREEEDVIYINPDSTDFNCARLIYEYIILSIPMHKTCDDLEDKECDESVLDHFYSGTEEDKEQGNPLEEALKNLKLN